MIFVTVGNTDPFDRLIQAVDRWSSARTPRENIFAQIGEGGFLPASFPTAQFLEPPTFDQRFKEAELVISHAGMGTILTALDLGKPLLVMPKRASLGEQRNEHQLATVEHVCRKHSIWVANDENEFPTIVDRLLETIRSGGANCAASSGNSVASRTLLDFVHSFVHQDDRQSAGTVHEPL